MAATYYSPLTIQTGQVPSTQTNFPIPYFQTAGRFATVANGGRSTSTSLYDVRPNTSTALAYDMTFELVPGTANATTGFFEMWILGASVADGGIVYMSSGDSSLTTDGSSTSTWPSQFKTVLHMPNGSSLTLADSTTNGNNGTATGAAAATGKVDGGTTFNSTTDRIALTNSQLTSGSAFSISWWEKIVADTNAFPSRFILPVTGGTGFYGLRSNNGTYAVLTFGVAGSKGQKIASGPSIASSVGVWHHFLVTGTDPSSITTANYACYVDGTTTTVTGLPDLGSNSNNRIGYDGGDNGADAIMDEFRIYNNQPTANWITTEYNSQSNNGAFWVLGTEVPVSGASDDIGARSTQLWNMGQYGLGRAA